ncbi:MAG: hypothetical protein ACOZNI_11480 [Myxococcota bacterium]
MGVRAATTFPGGGAAMHRYGVLIVLAACAGAHPRVDLGDLARHDAEAREESLGPAVVALGTARTDAVGARQAVQAAERDVDAAEAGLDAAAASVDAAMAEVEAARALRDRPRLGSAESAVAAARRGVSQATARVSWKREALRLAKERVDLADATVDLRESELELARAQFLADVEDGATYDLGAFTARVEGARKVWERERDDVTRAARRTDEAESAWRRAGGATSS